MFRPYNLAVRMTFKDSWFQCCGWREFWLVSIRLAYKSGSGIFVQEGSCVKLLASFWHQRLNVWDLLDWKTEAKSFEKVQLLVDMCLCAWRRRVVHFFYICIFLLKDLHHLMIWMFCCKRTQVLKPPQECFLKQMFYSVPCDDECWTRPFNMSNVVEYNRQDLFPSAASSMLSGKRKRDTFKHGTKGKKKPSTGIGFPWFSKKVPFRTDLLRTRGNKEA